VLCGGCLLCLSLAVVGGVAVLCELAGWLAVLGLGRFDVLTGCVVWLTGWLTWLLVGGWLAGWSGLVR
jgi:hypothetical protein